MPGRPDWLTTEQQHQQPIIAVASASYSTGTTQLFSGASSAWASLQFRLKPTSGVGTFKVNWFADAGLTISLGSDSWVISGSTGLQALYPVQGPFCQIQIIVPAATTLVTSNYICPTNIPVTKTTYTMLAQFLQVNTVSVPASNNVQYGPAWIMRGEGSLYFFPFDTTGKLNIQVIQIDASFSFVGFVFQQLGPTGLVFERISIPDVLLLVQVVNTDAGAAHSFNLSLTVPLDV